MHVVQTLDLDTKRTHIIIIDAYVLGDLRPRLRFCCAIKCVLNIQQKKCIRSKSILNKGCIYYKGCLHRMYSLQKLFTSNIFITKVVYKVDLISELHELIPLATSGGSET